MKKLSNKLKIILCISAAVFLGLAAAVIFTFSVLKNKAKDVFN